jgi:hypothetical protein
MLLVDLLNSDDATPEEGKDDSPWTFSTSFSMDIFY